MRGLFFIALIFNTTGINVGASLQIHLFQRLSGLATKV